MRSILERQQPAPRRFQRLAWFAGGVALGVAAAYLVDPARGRQRREQLQRHGGQVLRNAGSPGTRGGGAVGDPAVSGAADELTPDLKEPSDAVLIERVRSEAVGPSAVRNSAVVTTVEGGTVTVRGQVDSEDQREDLLARVRGVEGVEDVADLTHLPQESAPTRS